MTGWKPEAEYDKQGNSGWRSMDSLGLSKPTTMTGPEQLVGFLK
jgi:hypothetical protein